MKQYDLVIIGAGPAGMTAAIYGVRSNLKVLLLDKLAPGGQIINTNEIENYLGVGRIGGADLAMKMFEHCMELNVEFDYKTVSNIELKEDGKKLITLEEDDDKIEALSVIVATGARPRTLEIPGEEKFKGTAISWCAICDGAKYKDKDVIIIGGGNSAVEEGIYLASFVKSLKIVTDFELTADPIACSHLRSFDNVEVYTNMQVDEFIEENSKFKGLKFHEKNNPSKVHVITADGAFEYVGSIPSTEFIKNLGITNEYGYILAEENMQTKIPGIYGAGDCINKHLRQVATATSDGAIAAQDASYYIKKLKLK